MSNSRAHCAPGEWVAHWIAHGSVRHRLFGDNGLRARGTCLSCSPLRDGLCCSTCDGTKQRFAFNSQPAIWTNHHRASTSAPRAGRLIQLRRRTWTAPTALHQRKALWSFRGHFARKSLPWDEALQVVLFRGIRPLRRSSLCATPLTRANVFSFLKYCGKDCHRGELTLDEGIACGKFSGPRCPLSGSAKGVERC
ncbi:hypothetical protein HYPSUDRAFT_1044571 [Hypholoma sublateritium FD-334 SS-4]|uniref:Uncharacterized protein n=1 Tax=Hypholoma sublateritium (strain FD-334 SS-4) TaxID=945553 RepID=A0A0D2KR56_HYPSF|nr:hypothetical protein HYPSUDRAFT_1044571 [Hypholoma sublateritium FD-334 SS-4]